MQNPLRRIAFLSLACALPLAFAACGDDDGDDTDGEGGGGEITETFDIQVAHLSSDTPEVMVYVAGDDGDAAALPSPLGFTSVAGPLNLPAGEYTFNVRTADAAADSAPALSITSSFSDGDIVKVIATGLLAGSPDLQTMVLAQDATMPADGNLRVRLVHAASSVGEVDIWDVTDMDNPAEVLMDVPFSAVADYIEIPAGAYTFGLDVDNDMVPDVTFTTPELGAGTIADVVAVDTANGPALWLWPITGAPMQVDAN